MPFARKRDVTDTIEFLPRACTDVKLPGIVVMILTIRATKDIDRIFKSDDGMASPFGWNWCCCVEFG
jgi:hypothetical protein